MMISPQLSGRASCPAAYPKPSRLEIQQRSAALWIDKH